MLSCSAVTDIGSFNSERKSFGLFLGPFRGPFFHQGLEWFLFVLFFTVLAFTHISHSLYLRLIGCVENNAHLHRRINDHRVFSLPPTATGMRCGKYHPIPLLLTSNRQAMLPAVLTISPQAAWRTHRQLYYRVYPHPA